MTGNWVPATGGEERPGVPDRAASRGRGSVSASEKLPPLAEGRWFAGVVRQYEGQLVRYAGRIVRDLEQARDVVQDVFVKLLGEVRKGNRGEIEPHLAEWLYTVCRNRAVDLRRKESRSVSLGETPAESFGQVEPSSGPMAALEAADDSTAVLQWLDRLPGNQQEVIRLRFQHGLSYKEISAVTGLSVTNVGFLIHTGIGTLRKRMME